MRLQIERLRVGDSIGHMHLILGETDSTCAVALSAGQVLVVGFNAISALLHSFAHVVDVMAAAIAADHKMWHVHSMITLQNKGLAVTRINDVGSAHEEATHASRPTQAELVLKICRRYGIQRLTENEVQQRAEVARNNMNRRGSYVFNVDMVNYGERNKRSNSMYINDSLVNQTSRAASPLELLMLADRLCGQDTWLNAMAMYMCGLNAATHYAFTAAAAHFHKAHHILHAAYYGGPLTLAPWVSSTEHQAYSPRNRCPSSALALELVSIKVFCRVFVCVQCIFVRVNTPHANRHPQHA
jgi:hypothetical protein